MLWLNYLIITYLAVTSILIFFSKDKKCNQRRIYLIINTLILGWLIYSPCTFESGVIEIITQWSPLLCLPIIHRETALLTQVFGKKTYDDWFINFEKKYFLPVMIFHDNNKGASRILSEFLHGCYLSFFLLIFGVPLYFYINQNYSAFYQCSFANLLLLLSCFMTHGLIPVEGPRNIFDKITDHRSHGLFFRLVHKVLADGSTPGTAFPSGHAGLAFIVIFMTYSLDIKLFYFILPIGLGLVISTVYGRFHYVIDVIIGFFYAVFAFFLTGYLYA